LTIALRAIQAQALRDHRYPYAPHPGAPFWQSLLPSSVGSGTENYINNNLTKLWQYTK